jgi:hypothetical protein
MLRWGSVLLACGVLGEVIGGTWFREFFTWDYPPRATTVFDTWIKVKTARAATVLGLLLLVAAGFIGS